MAIPPAFVVVGSTILRSDDSRVVRTLNRNKSSTAVLVAFGDNYADSPGSERRLSTVLEQVGDKNSSTHRIVVPFVTQSQRESHQLAVVSMAMTDRVCLITIQQLAEFSSPWDDSLVSATDETILSVIRRAASASGGAGTWPDLAGQIEQDLGQLNSIFLSNVLEDITQIARASFAEGPADARSRRRAFEQMLDTRSRLHNALTHLESNGLGHTTMAHGLRSAAAGCDASTASLTAMVAVVMQEQAAVQANKELERERSLVERDRFLAKLATALLLPGLWFGFLGTNALPSELWGWKIQSELSVVIVLTVGLGLALLGWLAIPRKVKS